MRLPRVFRDLPPLSLTVLQPLFELSRVDITVLPLVLALAVRFAVSVVTNVTVPIGKKVRTCTMLETPSPLSLVSVP